MKTLVLVGHHQIGGRQFHHGDELPPDTLSKDEVDRWLDKQLLIEYDFGERRSLYRLFALFSGAPAQERLSKEELTELALEA
jgi:hypothetical protein